MFAFIASGFLAIGTLSSQITDLLGGKISPEFSMSCTDTPENRVAVIKEISDLYGAFLTPEMHEGDLCEALLRKGMWIQKKDLYHPVPTPLQIALFISTLERELLRGLEKTCKGDAWVHLGYDYGPTSAILELIFREVGLDADFYYLLPYKSHTHISIHNGEITLNLNLKGPPI